MVLGDLNDTPASDPLKPLLQDTDLRDIATHLDSKHTRRQESGLAVGTAPP